MYTADEDLEHAHEKTVKNVSDNCASVSERNETSENKASVSTEGPDSSDITTPESGGNVDVAAGGSMTADSSSVDNHSTHLNADSVSPNPLSPMNSPVHAVWTLITQDDPLGLFTSTVTSTSSKMTADPRTSWSSENVVESARKAEESVLIRRISEDTIGQTSWVAAATDSSLRKCSSLNRLSSEAARRRSSTTTSAVASDVARVVGSRPSSASPRTSVLGGTFRSAASRFASKYREIRESMVPPNQSARDVLPVASGTSREYLDDVDDATSTAVTCDTIDAVTCPETDVAADENADTVGKTMPDITVTTQSGRSRLRVPTALYSPLGKYRANLFWHLAGH